MSGRDVGAVVALNTIGGIAGTLLTGFVLVPALGLVRTLAMLAIAAAAVGVCAVLHGPAVRRGTRWATLAIGMAAMLGAILTPPDRLARLLTAARGGTLVFYEESRGGTVAVVEQQAGRNRFKRLYIQGVSNSGDAHALAALHAPAGPAATPHSSRRAALGARHRARDRHHGRRAPALPGAGAACVRGASASGRARRVAVPGELRCGVRPADRHPRARWPSGAAAESRALRPHYPRAAATVGGGRRQPLFERFLPARRTRLRPGGLLAQWWPLPTQNDEDSRSLVRSFLDVFPYASLWTTEFHEMLLIGSAEPIELDVQPDRRTL